MALYLGDTEVAPVIEVPVPEKKYGVPIGGLLGDIDENGQLQPPTEPFTPDLSGIKSLTQPFLAYKFYNTGASGDIVLGIEYVNIDNHMTHCFAACGGLTSVSFPVLTRIAGRDSLQSAFASTGITSVSFPVLTEMSGDSCMDSCFQYCHGLTSVSFPALTAISSRYAMRSCFYGCDALTSVSFPVLTSVVPTAFSLSKTSAAGACFYGCDALTEIHFRADAQAAIEATNAYDKKWGATNATIYFDL